MIYHYTCPVPSCNLGASDEVEANILQYIGDHYEYHVTYDLPPLTPVNTVSDIQLREIVTDIGINLECILAWQEERGNK